VNLDRPNFIIEKKSSAQPLAYIYVEKRTAENKFKNVLGAKHGVWLKSKKTETLLF